MLNRPGHLVIAALAIAAVPAVAQTVQEIRGPAAVVPLVNGLPAGPHTVRVELEDANHRTLDRKTVAFVIPPAG